MVRGIDTLTPRLEGTARALDGMKAAKKEGRTYEFMNTAVQPGEKPVKSSAGLAHSVYLECKKEKQDHGPLTHTQFTSAAKVLFKLSQSGITNKRDIPEIFKEFVKIALLNVTPAGRKTLEGLIKPELPTKAGRPQLQPEVDRSTKPHKKEGPPVDRSTKPHKKEGPPVDRSTKPKLPLTVEQQLDMMKKAALGYARQFGVELP